MASYKHVDIDHLYLMADGSVDFTEDLIGMFIKQAPVFTAQLEDYCTREEYVSLAKLAHRVKGSASAIGINGLAALMREIESKATLGENQNDILDVIKEAQTIAAEATEELKHILNDHKNR